MHTAKLPWSRGWNLLLWSAIMLVLLALLAPLIFPNRLSANRTEAMNNLRQLRLSLAEFEAEYGRFPDSATRSRVKEETGTALTLGDSSSNQLFRQLIAYGLKSEKPFWCQTNPGSAKPDDRFHSDATALSPGECGFAYIPGLSSASDPSAPIIMTSLLKGSTTFDPAPFNGKALILFRDAAKELPIDKAGRVLINGMDIFDPRQPFWKAKAPDIKWPE